MNLQDYFTEKEGTGIFSTASSDGQVNSAIYSRPHVDGKDSIILIMRNKKSRANLLENNKASYLFLEKGDGYKGVRLSLTKTSEVQDDEAIAALSRRKTPCKGSSSGERFLVHFKVDKAITLIGDNELELA